MKLDLRRFLWDSSSRQLISDYKALDWDPDDIWPDVLDIVSHHTGVTEQFHRSQTMWSSEGQCQGMVYEPANMKLNVRVTVFGQ